MTLSGSSPLQNIPLPIGTDAPPDIPLVMAAIVGAIEKKLVMVFASEIVRDASIPAPTDGMIAYISANQRLDIYDGVSWRPMLDIVVPAVHAYVSGTQTVPANAWYAVSYDTENYDTSAMHDNVHPTRITVPTSGLYQVNTCTIFSFSQANYFYREYSAARATQLRVNAAGNVASGTQVSSTVADAYARTRWYLFDLVQIFGFGNAHTSSQQTMDVRLNAGDHLELFVWQATGQVATLAFGASKSYMQVRRVSS